MNRKPAVVLAILSLLFLLGLACFGTWRVADARDRARRSAQGDFMALSRLVSTAYAQGGSFGSELFRQQLRQELSRGSGLLAVLVNPDPAGEPLYLIPGRSHLIASGPQPRTLVLEARPSWSTQVFSLPLALPDGSRVTLQAAYAVLRQGDAVRAIGECLYLIAAFFLCLLIAWIVSALAASARASRSAASPRPIEPFGGQGLRSSLEGVPLPSFGPLSSAEEEEDYSIPNLETGGPAAGGESPVDEDFPSLDLPAPEELAAQENAASPDSARGLYEPDTGIGWADYLPDRLDAEIERARSQGKDLSLLLLRGAGEAAREGGIASDLVSFFGFRDLVFGYGEEGYAVILPEKGIDLALSLCQDFQERGALTGRSRDALRIGVASLSGRETGAEVLIEEAAGALDRALISSDAPLIGFKADAERFATHLSGRL